jgi:uncharacterized damage-inducible protein DinB
MHEVFDETLAYLPPARMLEGLTTEEAEQRIPNLSHSVADIVAHSNFWLDWFCKRCEGVAEPMVASAAQGWPGVPSGGWPAVREAFLLNLQRAAALGSDDARLGAPISPAIEFPPLARYTTRDALMHVAVHTAHHLGQVVFLRQVMGRWPPPSGSWTF